VDGKVHPTPDQEFTLWRVTIPWLERYIVRDTLRPADLMQQRSITKLMKAVSIGALAPLLVLATQKHPDPNEEAPTRVRYPEGIVHGFLLLRTLSGNTLAQGDLLQVARGDTVEGRILFRFKDGSIRDETGTYTQRGVFLLQSYHLIQRGPSFEDDLEVWMDGATGRYRVKSKAHKDGDEELEEGTLELPRNTYNGLVLTILKNLTTGAIGNIHVVAFMPKPRIVRVEVQPAGEQKLLLEDLQKAATHYVLKPRLGTFTTLFAKVLGKMPPDNHAWILTGEIPTFVRFEGPLYPEGPIRRIEQTTLSWPP
jgi:hypothetical protein